MRFVSVDRYDDWRQTARQLLQQNIGPGDVQFHSDAPSQPSLFGDSPDGPAPDADRSKPGGETSRTADSNQTVPTKPHRVPQAFLDLAEKVACHSDASRWSLLYRSLWRLTHGQANLLEISTDEDVLRMHQMEKSVRRDAHKMKAFVRFRKVPRDDGREEFVAWHRPDHFVLRLTAPFFSRRFNGMHWTIMTPFESAVWDQSSLQYGPGMPASQAPEDDELEDMWRTYYKSIFNPARVKVKMMKSEMAVRYWQRLPEAQVIDELLRQAPGRVDEMIENAEGFAETATAYFPDLPPSGAYTLPQLADAARQCRACDLCETATQVVFGEGPQDANIVIVGEQPGDQEDIAGRPFVGPAGELLNQALVDAGLQRQELYVTNTVKHFKYQARGKQRLHKKPNVREISACRPWLEQELEILRPKVLLCLGATAAGAIFGRHFRVTSDRGNPLQTPWCQQTIASWHPSALLRNPDDKRRDQQYDQLVRDLTLAKKLSEER